MRPAGRVLLALAAAALGAGSARAAETWVLARSTLTYAVTHPLHHVEGTSTAARGKGTGGPDGGTFLIGVPVRTFDSGDSNRDLHMLEVTRAGTHPMILVRVRVAGDLTLRISRTLAGTAVVDFAGLTATYTGIALSVSPAGDGSVAVRGVLPLTCGDFALERPSLLGLPISEAISVTFETVWTAPKP